MGRKSRLKWERRKRDGWHPLIGKLGVCYRALATNVPMNKPTRITFIDEASHITPGGDHPKGGHDEAEGRGESPDAR